jgi:hypothetical protein
MLRLALKLVSIVVLAITLSGCPPPCESYLKVDNGAIPDSIISLVPYSDGDTVRFRHSMGHIIGYAVERERNFYTEIFDRGACIELTYETDNTLLTPDYPVFSFALNITGFDTTLYVLDIMMGSNYVSIPLNSEYWDNYKITDSVEVQSIFYYDVFKLKASSYWYNSSSEMYLDSLYFNFSSGILKLIMSNNENYTLHPDNL